MALSLPYREESRSPLAFSLSVLLHGLAAALLVAFLWNRPTPPPPPPPKVFELVAGPPEDSPPTDSAVPSDQSLQGLTATAFANLPTVPRVEPPAPAVPEVKPEPAPVKAVTAITTPDAKAGPKTLANPSKMTDLASFLKNHPAANPSTTAPARRGPAPNVGVNVGNIVTSLNRGGQGAGHSANASSGASGTSDDYVAKLIARLQEAFALPGGISGLSADVRLTIAADGTVVSAVLVRSSGNDEFDAAVRAALQRLTHVEPPPGGQEVTYPFTYRPDGP
jgi:TonB family protein